MNAPKQPSLAGILDDVAQKAGKTTILQHTPTGGFVVWVSPRELDPMTALMSAALSIMVRRGHNPDSKSGIEIRRMAVQANGLNVFWQVTDGAGAVIASGYAKNEDDAAHEVAKHVKLRPAVARDGAQPTTAEERASGLYYRAAPGEAPTPWEELDEPTREVWRTQERRMNTRILI